jgi:hypothetical protein
MISAQRLEAAHRRVRRAPSAPVALAEPENVIHFATSDEFLGLPLFPRQATLLKVATLSRWLLTAFDHRVIAGWQAGFSLVEDGDDARWEGVEGTPGDLLERMDWCEAHGLLWFREILLLVGRRGSKGYLGAILGAWVLWNLLSKENPHRRFGIDPGKRLTFLVFAGKKDQATTNQFRDIKTVLMRAPCFEAFHPKAGSDRIVMFTREQVAAGAHLDGADGALVEIRSAETTELGARGPAVPMLFFDEFAHVRGAGATANSADLYDSAVPATRQFGSHGIVLQTTSPWDRQGQAWKTAMRATGHSPVTGLPADPDHLLVQLPSWALYEDHESADQIDMWPGGPAFPAGLKPPITLNEQLLRQEAANPEAFAVEFRGRWRASRDAYFPAAFAEKLFGPHRGELLAQQTGGPLGTRYIAHADPSLSQANFGFAVCHAEVDEHGIPHVVFDRLHHWSPADFSDGHVDYLQIEADLFDQVQAFNLHTLSFDAWNSASSIQRLQRRVAQAGLPRRTQILNTNPTADLNWKAYEVFKTAVGHGIVHAPRYPLALAEFQAVEQVNGKVRPAEAGATRTKDVLDCMVFAAYRCIGDQANEIFDRLSRLNLGTVGAPRLSPAAAAGRDSEIFKRLSSSRRTNLRAAQRGYRGRDPTRRSVA